MAKGTLSGLPTVKAVRYETPVMKVATLGGALLAVPAVVVVLPLQAAITTSREKRNSAQVSDYGYMLMTRFVERASKEIPGWPSTTMVKDPVKDDYKDTDPLLEFKVERLLYAFLVGIRAESVVTLRNASGEVLWQDSFIYKSSDFDRKKSIDEYEADNFRLLREEIWFAADKTADSFLSHLKKDINTP
jgi:hypothetical protein